MAVLADTTITYQALTHFAFNVVALLGKSECRKASESEEARLRFMTPVLKAFASERAVAAMKECMTCLGGLGYMEEVGIGRYVGYSTYNIKRSVFELWFFWLDLFGMVWLNRFGKELLMVRQSQLLCQQSHHALLLPVLALDMIRASQKTFPAYLEVKLRIIHSLNSTKSHYFSLVGNAHDSITLTTPNLNLNHPKPNQRTHPLFENPLKSIQPTTHNFSIRLIFESESSRSTSFIIPRRAYNGVTIPARTHRMGE